MTTTNNKLKLRDYFTRCLLTPKDEYLKIINLYGFNDYDEVVDRNNHYKAIKCVSAVFDDIRNIVNSKTKLAIEYLKQEKLNEFNVTNVVDVGWGGSIQDSIRNLLNKEVHGYYFGTILSNKKDYVTNSFGYMFDQSDEEEDKEKIFNQVMMYELIFSAPHGSTIEYKKVKNNIKPILKNADNCRKISKC